MHLQFRCHYSTGKDRFTPSKVQGNCLGLQLYNGLVTFPVVPKEHLPTGMLWCKIHYFELTGTKTQPKANFRLADAVTKGELEWILLYLYLLEIIYVTNCAISWPNDYLAHGDGMLLYPAPPPPPPQTHTHTPHTHTPIPTHPPTHKKILTQIKEIEGAKSTEHALNPSLSYTPPTWCILYMYCRKNTQYRYQLVFLIMRKKKRSRCVVLFAFVNEQGPLWCDERMLRKTHLKTPWKLYIFVDLKPAPRSYLGPEFLVESVEKAHSRWILCFSSD